jgi:hypothetical protein
MPRFSVFECWTVTQMIEAMKIARFAAERCECWAQSFVRARPKREVGMSNERTSNERTRASGSGASRVGSPQSARLLVRPGRACHWRPNGNQPNRRIHLPGNEWPCQGSRIFAGRWRCEHGGRIRFHPARLSQPLMESSTVGKSIRRALRLCLANLQVC